MPTKQTIVEEVSGFFLHLIIATAGVLFLDAVLIFAIYSISSALPIQGPNFGTAYNPLAWIPALITGFLVNRKTMNRSACLVGILGVIVLFALMQLDVSGLSQSEYYVKLTGGHYWRYEFQQMLSPSDRACGSSECLGKLFFTVPVVVSVAYSLGAWVGLKYRRTTLSPQTANQ